MRLCEYRGYEVAHIIRDNDRSASVGVRPGYLELKRLLEAGAVDVVVVLRIDRLLRKMIDLEDLIDISEKTGVSVVTVEGDVNLSSVMGRQIARIMASIARGEVETKGERHRLANSQRAKAGLPHAGRRAFGYAHDGMTLVEEEALALKEVGQRFLSGYTYTQLADWLNDSGYVTTMGNPFYGVAVRQMLQRKRYAGVREHDGAEYPAAWPAIYDEDTYARIQHRVRQRSEAAGNRPAFRRHLLTGLLNCGACGAPLNGTTSYDRKTGEARKSYRCNRDRGGCGRTSRLAYSLEWWVRELICYRLDSAELQAMLDVSGSSAALLRQQAALEAKLTELLDAWTDGTLTRAEYKRAKERATTSLEAVHRQLEVLHHDRALSGLLGSGEAVRARWQQEGIGWQRGIIELLIEDITINPSTKKPRIKIEGKTFYFDSATIDLRWKF